MRIGIIGGAGQLGSALIAEFAGDDVAAPAHGDVAFEDAAALEAFMVRERPDVLINCSAFHHVDTCEREPQRAFAMNALAVDAAAALCGARDTVFVTISSDYVFDGFAERAYREDDAANPLTVYGASKLAGELLTRRHGPEHLIIRTSGLFGTAGTSNKGTTLIEKVLRQAEAGTPTRMVADVVFSPSYGPHVARALRALIEAGARGTHHLTNGGACSWYEFVREAFERSGHGDAPLESATYASMGNPTRRPMYSPLTNTTLANHHIEPLPPWQDALDAFLAARRSRMAVHA